MILPENAPFTLSFRAEEGFQAASGGDPPALSLRYDGGRISVTLFYDADPRPLSLSGKALSGELCELRAASYRLTLSSGGRVLDEEWPFGTPLFAGKELVSSHPLSLVPGVPEEREAPETRFTGAEGWRPGGGVFVGDCMPYAAGGRYHVLYLKDRRHHKSKWGKGAHQWEHISSADLREWTVHPTAVPIDDAREGSICTGSFLEKDGVSYLFYTVRTVDGSPAPIRRSLSPDGLHFRKDPGFSFTISDRYRASSARDPKVFRGGDGAYHMLLTTTLLSEGKGCLLHLVSDDLDAWREVGPLYLAPGEDEPECPDLFTFGDYTYLVFSLKGVGQYRFTRTPLSGWILPPDPVIPCESVPKAAVFQGKILFAGFHRERGYAGTMTFRRAVAKEDGTLVFLQDAGVARYRGEIADEA